MLRFDHGRIGVAWSPPFVDAPYICVSLYGYDDRVVIHILGEQWAS